MLARGEVGFDHLLDEVAGHGEAADFAWILTCAAALPRRLSSFDCGNTIIG
jgi:hypothetical protein